VPRADIRRLALFHDNSGTSSAVQQQLEVESGELIAGVRADMRGNLPTVPVDNFVLKFQKPM